MIVDLTVGMGTNAGKRFLSRNTGEFCGMTGHGRVV
jgi:hypothetical protein